MDKIRNAVLSSALLAGCGSKVDLVDDFILKLDLYKPADCDKVEDIRSHSIGYTAYLDVLCRNLKTGNLILYRSMDGQWLRRIEVK